MKFVHVHILHSKQYTTKSLKYTCSVSLVKYYITLIYNHSIFPWVCIKNKKNTKYQIRNIKTEEGKRPTLLITCLI